jgi:methylmalonyl-CoA mutase N-terminal domain/subunit
VESGETTIVGVNRFADDEPTPEISRPDYRKLESEQVARLVERRNGRDAKAVEHGLASVRSIARTYGDNAKAGASRQALMPAIIDAVRARASVGEIADVLRQEWGAFVPA